MKIIIRLSKINYEAYTWLIALILLALMDPNVEHLSLCPIKNMGFTFCPGCGLGHSISFLFRGELINSWSAHPLGFPALVILAYRIIYLMKVNYRTIKTNI